MQDPNDAIPVQMREMAMEAMRVPAPARSETLLPEHEVRVAVMTLRKILVDIEAADTSDSRPADYPRRNRLVFGAIYAALRAGYAAGVAIDHTEPDWPVAYIELPDVGQVSWHVPAHGMVWDGHTTKLKYDRCAAYRYMTRLVAETSGTVAPMQGNGE